MRGAGSGRTIAVACQTHTHNQTDNCHERRQARRTGFARKPSEAMEQKAVKGTSRPPINLVNAMSVDVEEHFQVSAFESAIDRADWDTIPSRVQANTDRILQLFDDRGVSATFFVLGWIAERYPGLIRRIQAAGHEVASHGFSHIRATTQQPDEFRRDVGNTKKLLEDVSGNAVKGFRAASFSISEANLWALDVLEDVGYQYSSSIYPIHHDTYGMPTAPRFAFRAGGGSFLEIPVSTVKVLNKNFPCGGGGYFRLLPYAYFRWALNRVTQREGQPVVFYFHHWEIDPRQPKQTGLSIKTRLRHYTNLHRMEARLDRLLGEFRWNRMDRIFLDSSETTRELAAKDRQSA